MPDTVSITTALKDAGGADFNGTLYATLTARLILAGGDVVQPGRLPFSVVDGVATGFALPITEDSNPSGISFWLEMADSQGRVTPVGSIAPPRSAGAIDLSDYLTVAEV